MQRTIKNAIRFSGIGLHTGAGVDVKISPSGENTGIRFVRNDISGSPVIKAVPENIVATNFATSLGANGAKVSTVEHLLAAFYGLGVDNAVIEMNGPEVPIMDGSAYQFIEMIERAGLEKLSGPRKYLVIKRPIKVAERDKYVLLMPASETEFTIDYSIDFAHPFLSSQSFSRPFSRDVFRYELGSARTFGFLRDVEAMRANGLAKGGSLKNAIVIGDNSILNEDGLRFPDEFVRHKVLDLMGDISIIGAPIIGRLKAYRSGHALNFKLLTEILRRPGRWELTEEPLYAPDAQTACPALLQKMVTA